VKISLIVALVAILPGLPQEPAPRRLAAIPVKLSADLATVSGARELKDGRILISDAKRAAVFVIDPKAGTTTQLGSAGGSDNQYAQPGGFYAGVADTVYLLDRGQARVLVLTPSGSIVGPRSIRRKGVTESSDSDLDYQQVDVRGLAYFVNRSFRLSAGLGASAVDSLPLVRFDESRQHYDTVALLRQPQKRITQMDAHMQVTREIHGTPHDGWGIAADGSVAIVRAAPYRIDWISPAGKVSRGSVVSYDPVPYVGEDKLAITAGASKSAPSAGIVDADGSEKKLSSPAADDFFAPTKAAFDPTNVIVSSDGQVWVPRNQRFGVKTVLYDVFDRQGERLDRVEFPANSRVIGFGSNVVFTIERDDRGSASLHEYSTKRAR
jgi:hypothetical protein